MALYMNALLTCLQPINLLLIFAMVCLGIVFGAIPGLSATLAIALMLPSIRPRPAAMRPFQILPLESAATSVMAQKHREKYSHGPSVSAKSAITGESTVASRTENTVPMKDAVMPTASALLDWPFCVMG